MAALESIATGVHVLPFAMRDRFDLLVYRLFHCTRNDKGLEEMKRAMKKVDPSGRFTFSDKASATPDLFAVGDTDESVALQLRDKFGGREIAIREVDKFVLTKTGLSGMRPPLRLLEDQGLLRVACGDASRRPGTFPTRLLHSMRVVISPP